MHSVTLNGKTYISSRRAAKIAGYTTDYVGQLCRAGKLECTRVGRVWYVTENSVMKHKESADESFIASRGNGNAGNGVNSGTVENDVSATSASGAPSRVSAAKSISLAALAEVAAADDPFYQRKTSNKDDLAVPPESRNEKKNKLSAPFTNFVSEAGIVYEAEKSESLPKLKKAKKAQASEIGKKAKTSLGLAAILETVPDAQTLVPKSSKAKNAAAKAVSAAGKKNVFLRIDDYVSSKKSLWSNELSQVLLVSALLAAIVLNAVTVQGTLLTPSGFQNAYNGTTQVLGAIAHGAEDGTVAFGTFEHGIVADISSGKTSDGTPLPAAVGSAISGSVASAFGSIWSSIASAVSGAVTSGAKATWDNLVALFSPVEDTYVGAPNPALIASNGGSNASTTNATATSTLVAASGSATSTGAIALAPHVAGSTGSGSNNAGSAAGGNGITGNGTGGTNGPTYITQVVAGGISSADVDQRLAALSASLTQQFSTDLAGLSTGSGGSITNVYQQIADSQVINQLTNVNLTTPTIENPNVTGGNFASPSIGSATIANSNLNNVTVNGGTIAGVSISGSTLDLTGTIFAGGDLTAANITATGTLAVAGNANVTGTLSAATTTTTDLIASGASTLNELAFDTATGTSATTTSFFSSAGHFAAGLIDDLTSAVGTIGEFSATDSTTTNATSTNAFSTNLFATNGTVGNLAATSLAAVNLTAYNAPIAPAFDATSTSIASVFPFASTTAFSASGTGYFGGIGIGTSTPTLGDALAVQGSGLFSGALSVSGLTTLNGALLLQGATTTAVNGINLTSGCFAVGGVCVAGGGGGSSGVGIGTQGQFPYYNLAGQSLAATSSVFLSQTGQFGIGTTTPSPSYLLAVQGSGLFSGNISGANLTATGTLAVGGSTLVTTSGGDVGIGTASPTSKLSVVDNIGTGAGDATFPGDITVGENCSGNCATATGGIDFKTVAATTGYGMKIGAISGGGLSALQFLGRDNSNSWTELMRISDNGDLGIGTTTASSNLAVSGNGTIGVDYDFAAPTNGLAVEGNVTIGTTTPSPSIKFQVGGSALVSGSGTFGGALTAGGNFTSSGNVTTAGTASSTNLVASGGVTFSLFTPGSIPFFGTAGALSQNNADFFWDNTNDRLGIGTTTPSAPLDVYTNTNNIAAIFRSSGAAAVSIGASSGTALIQSLTNDSHTNTANLAINSSGGNVGIGTTTPQSTLAVGGTGGASIGADYDTAAPANGLIVEGNVGIGTTSPTLGKVEADNNTNGVATLFAGYNANSGASAQSQFRLFNDQGTGSSNGAALFLTSSGFASPYTSALGLWNYQNGPVIFATNGAEHMRINANGTVGIGTTSPASLLSLATGNNGTVGLTVQGTTVQSALSPGQLFLNSAYGTTNGSSIGGSAGILALNSAANGITMGIAGTVYTTLTTSGNFGIGTTSPLARLDLVGLNNSTAPLFQVSGLSSFATTTMFAVDYEGNVNISSSTATTTIAGGFSANNGGIVSDYSGGYTSIQNLYAGAQSFPSDSGQVTWMDMPVTSASAAGVVNSYSANLNGNPLLTLFGVADGAGNLSTTSVGIGSTSPWGFLSVNPNGNTQGPSFVVGSSTATQLVVAQNGNVGIGTANPTGKLHVQGGTSYFTTSDWSVGSVGSGLDINQGASTGNTYSNIQALTAGAASTGNLILNGVGGNVGVGTTSPTAKLEVFDTTNTTTFTGAQTQGLRINGGSTATAGDYALLGFGSADASLSQYTGNLAQIGAKISSAGSILQFGTSNNFASGITNTALTIDQNGNVGIGTTPNTWSGYTALQLGSGASFANSGNTPELVGNAYWNGTAWVYINSSSATLAADNTSGNFLWYTAPSGTAGNPATFTQKMTLDNSGNLSLTNEVLTTGAAGFRATGNYSATPSAGQTGIFAGNAAYGALVIGSGSTADVGLFNKGGTPVLYIPTGTSNVTVAGCINYNGGTSGTCLSDERVKQDVAAFNTFGLTQIEALNPVTYQYNGLGGTVADGNTRMGLIAQQVEQVAPGIVTTTYAKLSPNDATTTQLYEVDYSALTFGLINAVKTLGSVFDATEAGTATSSIISFYQGTTTPAVVIDAEGNVGIGTSTPAYNLHVIGSVGAESFVTTTSATSTKDVAYLSSNDDANILNTIDGIKVANYLYNDEPEGSALHLGIIASDAPSQILSANGTGIDLNKLATFTLAGLQAEDAKLAALTVRVAALESEVGSSTQSSSGSGGSGSGSGGVSMASVIEGLQGLGADIEQGVAHFTSVIADSFTVGSASNPTGITLYDKTTGQPYCLSINNGTTTTAAGACSAASGDSGSSSNSDSDTGSSTPISISVNGANPAEVALGSTYMDLGATLNDPAYPNLDIITTGTVDTTVVGTSTITYSVTDPANNSAIATRTVVVYDPNATSTPSGDGN